MKKIEEVHYCKRRDCGKPVAASSWPRTPFCGKRCKVAWQKDVATFCKGLTPQQIKALGGVRKWREALLHAAVTLNRPLDNLVPRPRWTSPTPPRPGWGGACYREATEESRKGH